MFETGEAPYAILKMKYIASHQQVSENVLECQAMSRHHQIQIKADFSCRLMSEVWMPERAIDSHIDHFLTDVPCAHDWRQHGGIVDVTGVHV